MRDRWRTGEGQVEDRWRTGELHTASARPRVTVGMLCPIIGVAVFPRVSTA